MNKNARGRPKDPEKGQKILKAATFLLMKNGLKSTSMDAVAKQAGVSKQTLYSHFKNKDDLYRAVIRRKIETYEFSQKPFEPSDSLEEDLYKIACQFLDLILDEESIALYRTVIAEGRNYKKTAELFYEYGPKKIISQLSTFLDSLNVVDTEYLALLYLNMIESEWHMKSLIGLLEKPTDQEIKNYARKTAKTFMHVLAYSQDK